MKKIQNILIYVLIVFVAFILISLLISTVTSKDKLPNIFGYKMFIILSGSMEPTIKTGDVIISKSQETISNGDIITFQDKKSGNRTTHRVVEIVFEGRRRKI
ncbi:MAG: signal peptidase I [Lachnospiraceae bacterium]|jgi:signal peptidase|nr:signal peptidase I [Lachnospiraceae bacterium]